ncbi:MAG: hypothetical protein P0S94_03585 [Simkaniaceae bacterium]|nr:hypothetical protein [Simkaniaceae bacterium]
MSTITMQECIELGASALALGIINSASGALGSLAVTTLSAGSGGLVGLAAAVADVGMLLIYNNCVEKKNQIDTDSPSFWVIKAVVVLSATALMGATSPIALTAMTVSTLAICGICYYGLSQQGD